MFEEFYEFIAKTIINYFMKIEESGELQDAESFSLKLDDEKMVLGVDKAIQKIIESQNKKRITEIKCLLDNTYYATTMAISDNKEIIIASQTDGMSTDFLCATLRNSAKELNKPILMISSTLIDSAISGSRNMAAPGMPFYYENIINEIKVMLKDSSNLSRVEKKIIEFEIERRSFDAFNDKDSFYEYTDLLSVLASGEINNSNYKNFRLFPIKAKSDYSTNNVKEIEDSIRKNNELFEKFSSALNFSSVDNVFKNEFESDFLYKINNDFKKDPDNWSDNYLYSDLLEAKSKKQKKTDNPLLIESNNIEIICGDLVFPREINKDYLIRKEGKQTGKIRKQSIIIFNNTVSHKVYLKIKCNTNIKQNEVTSKIVQKPLKDNRTFNFEYNCDKIIYDRISIKDSTNAIEYVFDVCIIDISASYLLDTIRYKALVDSKKKRIKLSDIDKDLVFNENAINEVCEPLIEMQSYNCNLDQKLTLNITNKVMSNYEDGVDVNINFGGVPVSLLLKPDTSGNQEITGKEILKDKYAFEQSFTITGNMHMHRDSFEYFAKGKLLKEIKLENQIIKNNLIIGSIKSLNADEEIQIVEKNCEISELVKKTYLNYINVIKQNNTLPSLLYLTGELKEKAEEYINSFFEYYNSLKKEEPLTLEQRNTILIGSIIVGKNEEIWLTPLHPLNVAYQLSLLNENGFDTATSVIIEKLSSANLFPYLKFNNSDYKVSDQSESLEWNYYAPVENKKYMGRRKFVPKLVEDKIVEYVDHFKYLFNEINNYNLKINLINMGDCSEVFQGIAQYYLHEVNKNPNSTLLKIEVNIYGDVLTTNNFFVLKNYDVLKKYLKELKLSISQGISMSSLESILSNNISCFFHSDKVKKYEYAHISFYEMESNIMSGTAVMEDMETGVSLSGLISGIPSSKYGSDYRTGFGLKYADNASKLIELAKIINSIAQVGNTSNPYNGSLAISTQIDNSSVKKIEDLYSSSNWVVFVEPKVELSFFTEKEEDGELLIIHYSDQYTSSSGYDAITITHKTNQYIKVIEEQLKDKKVECSKNDAISLINLFNSINGDWLLRLISVINGNRSSTYFDREKISIAAGIKLMLAYLKNKDVIWIPISLEEMLRVSGSASLSSKEGILSAKNLGFEKGATSDDLLFVGFNFTKVRPLIYFYPVEVKTGANPAKVLEKAVLQVTNTYKGLRKSFSNNDLNNSSISTKVQRDFLMQLLITSCKKMKIYHIDDSSDWDLILDKYRKDLLNDNFEISFDVNEFLGNAAVLSFSKASYDRSTAFNEEGVNILKFAESDEYGLTLKSVNEIESEIRQIENLKLLNDIDINSLTGDMSKINVSKNQIFYEENLSENKNDNLEVLKDIKESESKIDYEKSKIIENEINNSITTKGMNVIFGTNQQNGNNVIWEPNNTDVLFHTNTGIIGTMGTGKTQFTKSLITQLYFESKNNIGNEDLGILIFDYKGDYNENNKNFVKITNAKVLKPYHLPINPFAVIKPKAYKPLLPMHVANTFRDTLCKIYNLGAKQQNAIFNCVKQAYENKGIIYADPDTWNNTPPTFKDVYDIYEADEEIKKGDSLSSVLSDLNNFELFEPDANKSQALYDLLKGVVVIDLNGYDSKIQNLIVAITLDLFYSNMQAAGSSILDGKYRQMKKLLLVDEADNFMSEDFPSLKKIMKEGREYGVGVVLSTQFLKHFTTNEGDYSKYILTWVVHNVADLKRNEIEYIFRTDSKSPESVKLYNDIGKLEKHYSIVKIGNNKPIYVYDKPFWKLYQELENSNE